MKTIEEHIEKDKHLLEDPTISSAARRHYKEELHELEVYADHHHDEIEAGDHHDPNALELFCEMHPDEPECLVYDDQDIDIAKSKAFLALSDNLTTLSECVI